MGIDYSKDNEYTEVVCYDLTWELEEYNLEELHQDLTHLVASACEQGLVGVHLWFKSRMVPYEDWLDCPAVIPVGYRKKTDKELKAEDKQKQTEELAISLGTNVMVAEEIIRLQKAGKL